MNEWKKENIKWGTYLCSYVQFFVNLRQFRWTCWHNHILMYACIFICLLKLLLCLFLNISNFPNLVGNMTMLQRAGLLNRFQFYFCSDKLFFTIWTIIVFETKINIDSSRTSSGWQTNKLFVQILKVLQLSVTCWMDMFWVCRINYTKQK